MVAFESIKELVCDLIFAFSSSIEIRVEFRVEANPDILKFDKPRSGLLRNIFEAFFYHSLSVLRHSSSDYLEKFIVVYLQLLLSIKIIEHNLDIVIWDVDSQVIKS